MSKTPKNENQNPQDKNNLKTVWVELVKEENDIPPYPGYAFRLILSYEGILFRLVEYGASIEPEAAA